MKINMWVALCICFMVLSAGCSKDVKTTFNAKPTALGLPNTIVVLTDKQLWESAVGDTFRYYFSSAYPILPQPEPLYDLKHYTVKDVLEHPVRKELRTYMVLGDINNADSPTTKMIFKDIGEAKVMATVAKGMAAPTIGKDKWAQGQMLIYQFADSHDKLIDAIKKNFPMVSKRIHESDKQLIEAKTFFGQQSNTIMKEVKDSFNINIKIPAEYYIAIKDKSTFWIRKETRELSSNILIHRLPYSSKEQFTKEGIKTIRNKLGKKYITTATKGAYMQVNDVDLPFYLENTTLNDQFAVESRGIWDMENDFMGGPFISYLIHDKDKNELLYVDGFVHAPGKAKRQFIQELECVLNTVRL